MPMSGIVPIPCTAATEGVVQLPADSKHPSKLSGAWARRAAQRKVLEHVSLGHGNRVVQRKSPPLVGFNSFCLRRDCSRLSTDVPSCSTDKRSFLAESFVHLRTRFCSRVQDVCYAPFDKEADTLCSTACWEE
jgi:hypothetical protein